MSKISLINGEALEEMSKLKEKSVDLILVDPPFGQLDLKWDRIIPFNSYVKLFDNKKEKIFYRDEAILHLVKGGLPYKDAIAYFEITSKDGMWDSIKRVIKDNGAVLIFGNEPFSSQLRLSNLDWYKYDYHWEKERLTNIFQVKKRAGKTIENISVFYNKQPTYNPQMVKHEGKLVTNKVKNGKIGKVSDSGNKRVKEYKDTGFRYPTQVLKFKRDILKSNLHPTQKPVKLLENLINTFSNEGELVLDFTAGSFSSGEACFNTNRDCICIELEKEIFDVGENRINNLV